MTIRSAALIAALLSTTACASIVKGGNQELAVASSPSDARITVTNSAGETTYTGSTPATVILQKKRGWFEGETYDVTVQKAGYSPQTVQLEPSISGWYAGGNLLFGGLVGWLVVDPLTGAMWSYAPKTIDASLARQMSGNPDGLNIVLVEDAPEIVKAEMEPVGEAAAL